jgi:hypothetical protein
VDNVPHLFFYSTDKCSSDESYDCSTTNNVTLVVTVRTCYRCLTDYTYNHLSMISWPSGGAAASDYKIGGTTSFKIFGFFPT